MSQFIEVIDSLDRSPETIVSRFPEQGSADIKLGAQLVVRESQAAVFFRDGRALDTFGPGRHTLSTLNVPVLTKLLSLPTGFQSPFQAEVMFCNLKTFPNQKWGTAEPILFRDSELDMVRLRSFGVFSFRVSNPQVFTNTLVGTVGEFTTDAVSGFFKNVIVSHVADFLGEHLRTLLDLPQLYSELSAGIEAHVIQDFAKYGVSISDFKIMSISPPDYVQEAIDKRSAMAAVGSMDKFMRYQAARAIEQAAGGEGSGEAGSGGLAGAGVGVGAGLGMGAGMAGLVSQAFQPRGAPCTGCQAPLAAGARFCAGCGRPVSAAGESCGSCQQSVPASASFCPSCGAGQQRVPCGSCGAENPSAARYCVSCGTALGSE